MLFCDEDANGREFAGGHRTTATADIAIERLREIPDDRDFALFVSFLSPHYPLQPAAEFEAQYRNVDIALRDNVRTPEQVFTPTYSPDGWLELPIISNVGWAIISLSFFAGAFNVEIFRAGIEAVPESTKEAANSLGFNRSQIYMYIVMPLAVRVSLPALNNNLVNLVKTTTQAFGIAVPELLYQSVTIWNDYPSALYPTMLLVFVVYILLVGVLVAGMNSWEQKMRIPGYGT